MGMIKKLCISVLALVLTVSTSNVYIYGQDEETDVSMDAWSSTVFGDVGGDDKITDENFDFDVSDNGDVTISVANNRGKISGSTEGLAYFYQSADLTKDFTLEADVSVDSFESNNQVSFGLMVRDQILINENNKGAFGTSLAVGPLNVTKDPASTAFYRTDEGLTSVGAWTQTDLPEAGSTYHLSLKKRGDYYVTSVDGIDQEIISDLDFEDQGYIGLFVSRNATVTFSNVSYEVSELTASSMTVDANDMKTNYLLGESFDKSDLGVIVDYDDGSREIMTSDDIYILGYEADSVGSQTIHVMSQGLTQSLTVEVSALTITSMAIDYYPVKMTYYVGQTFDPTGMEIQGTYDDGYKTEILSQNDYEIYIDGIKASLYGKFGESGQTHEISIESTNNNLVSVDFEISVEDNLPLELSVDELPDQTIYFPDDELDLSGMAVSAYYSDDVSISLDGSDVEVSGFDSQTLGTEELTVSFAGLSTTFDVTVKEKEVTGLTLSAYPITTFYIGDSIDTEGIEVSQVYDDKTETVLSEESYTIDTSSVDTSQEGVYYVTIEETDGIEASLTYPVTVRSSEDYEWQSVLFGQSASAEGNSQEILEDGTIRLTSVDGDGKVTGDHDGINYYYTVLDASDNFSLSADIKVITYAKDTYDGQESFGIMARDAIGQDQTRDVFSSNMAAIGGYSGGTKSPIGTQLIVRQGVTASDGTGSEGITNVMLQEGRPETATTYPEADYHLTLEKTNSGFKGYVNDQEGFVYAPDILTVQDDKIYVGFYTARVATIEVSNIELDVSTAATDEPEMEVEEEATEPEITLLSPDKVSDTSYQVAFKSNISGKVTVKRDLDEVVSEKKIKAGATVEIPTYVNQDASTRITVMVEPSKDEVLTSYEPIVEHMTVTMKTYRNGQTIYVSPDGSSDGIGSRLNPLDLETAIDYVTAGQTIELADGSYMRTTPLVIGRYNDGTSEALKTLVAAEGASPVIDFDGNCEGVILSGDYWHIEGIDVARSAGNYKGFTVGGNHNLIENCRFYENGDTGLQISRTNDATDKAHWPAFNTILNCESFDNRDPSDNNADGFAAKLTVGYGNVFEACISHNNIDDGWDLYTKIGTGDIGAVTIKDCLAYDNGTLSDGTVGDGDKNGFKLGGEGIHVAHQVINCVSYANGAAGFTSNSNPGVQLTNCKAYNNQGVNLNLTTYSTVTEDFELDGFYSLQPESSTADNDRYPEELTSADNYTYQDGISVNGLGDVLSAEDFVSVEEPTEVGWDEDGNIDLGDFLQWVVEEE